MSSLAIVPGNSPYKADTREFVDQSMLWRERHDGTELVSIDLEAPVPARFRQVLAAIELHAPDLLAFFCHGLSTRLPQLGASIANVAQLAGAIARATTAPRVVLFTCLAGEDLISGADGPPGGDGGFADSLRDALVKHGATGAQVDAHGSSSQLSGRKKDVGGHTTHNPFVRRFAGPEDKAAVGGYWLVEPSHPGWYAWRKWINALGWREFPIMTRDQIRQLLHP